MLRNCHKEHKTKKKAQKTNCSFGMSAILVTPAFFQYLCTENQKQKKKQKKYPKKPGPYCSCLSGLVFGVSIVFIVLKLKFVFLGGVQKSAKETIAAANVICEKVRISLVMYNM